MLSVFLIHPSKAIGRCGFALVTCLGLAPYLDSSLLEDLHQFIVVVIITIFIKFNIIIIMNACLNPAHDNTLGY